jgi:hypothetical protein
MKNSELIYTGHDLIEKYLDPKFQDGNYGENSEPACIIALCFGLPFTVVSNHSGIVTASKEYAKEISTPAGIVDLKNQDLNKGIFGKFYAAGSIIGKDITIQNLNSVIYQLGKAGSSYKWDYIVISQKHEVFKISSKAGNCSNNFTTMNCNTTITLIEADGNRLASVFSNKVKNAIGIDIYTEDELLNSPEFHSAQGKHFSPARGLVKNPYNHATHFGFSDFVNGSFTLVVISLEDFDTLRSIFNSQTLQISMRGQFKGEAIGSSIMKCRKFSIRRNGKMFWDNLMSVVDSGTLFDSQLKSDLLQLAA